MDAIEKVKEAELEAEKIVKEAEKEASQILELSKEEYLKRYNEILREAKSEADKLVSSKREEGKTESKKFDKDLDDFVKKTSSMQGDKLDSASDLVVSRILGTNGNS